MRIYNYQLQSNCIKNIRHLEYCAQIFEIYIKFGMFWKRNDTHRSSIFEVIESERCGNYEYSCSNRGNLLLSILMKLSKKPLIFFYIFLHFWNLHETKVLKKKWASSVKYFWGYSLRNICLFKCIPGLISKNPFAVNLLTSAKTDEICRKVLLCSFFSILS